MVRKVVYRLVNVSAYRTAARVITVYESLRDEIVCRWNIPPDKVFFIPNGVDLRVFNDLGSGTSLVRSRYGIHRYCLFVGQLIPRKAPDLLLHALVEADTIRCAFVGEGPMRGRLESLAEKLGVADRVVFTGAVPPAELAAIYREADMLVLPSVSEATPLVVPEAMACGTPVVATRIAGLPTLVRDLENGFLVKPGDAGQLAVALRFMSADRAALRRMGAEAKRAAQRLLWSRIAGDYARLFQGANPHPALSPSRAGAAEVDAKPELASTAP